MKIEKLDGNKVKVDVTSDDLLNLNLNVDSLTPDSPELHAFLFQIMEKVKKETGFNPYSGQIVVEATPTGEGITLMVTRIGRQLQKKKTSYKKVRAVKKVPAREDRVYAFEVFDELCEAVKAADEALFLHGALYEYRKVHYLILENIDDRAHALFSEFCTRWMYPAHFRYFLEEHAKRVAHGDSLQTLVRGIKNL